MNVTMLLDMAADGFGDRVAIGRREDGLTAARLRDAAAVGAAAIREAGADAVVYLDVNGPAFPVALFAAARAGVPLVPVNYRLGSEQLDALLANHPKAFGIAAPDDQSDALRRAGISSLTSEAWLNAACDGQVPDDLPPGDDEVPAVVIYTSGTTSAPKGVLLRHHNLVSYVLGSVEFAGADADDAALVSVPPYHIAAVANVLTNLYAGRRSVVLERFTPAEWLQLVRDQGITNAMVVPTMLARINEADADKSLPTLRTLAYGGAPMPTAVIERALRTWPDVGFVNAYGLTETSSTIAVLGPEDHRAALASDDTAVRARLGSVGRVLPTVEVEIRDMEDRPVDPGVTGRICVRGEQVAAEYAGVGRAVDEKGYFDTRDQGYLDEEGYLFIGGRVDDTIIRGAENIAPAEIEDVLLRHPAVLDAAVVGVPDEEWGQRIEAAVVTRSGAGVESEELRAFVRGALRGSKTPDRIEHWEELPRTVTGKLLRRNVVARLVSGAGD
ncbi:class I adenylate-forming enzyme family protein [Peterkaempfera bronchialis]|uniref:Long-chain fatty acid--CoA ligase n=1 Tax=Peterkaempfera bronchialis TaxID=2126346 RepID=A0A345SR50_9ACTN|nr:fatty acid--CoA ligase family protein [Peterkaempfera bronchialis]AXI76205.1 long-chain fatty acid--CoA ligase [Peterkaempfera bronchialis]